MTELAHAAAYATPKEFLQTPAPPVFEPDAPRHAASLTNFVADNDALLRARLQTWGAVVLRGFALRDPAEFSAIASSIAGPLGGDYEGPSPRQLLAPGVYSASEVWSALVVAEHAEMSYLQTMPRLLFFWCRTAAPRGGATTLVDGRRVLAQLDPALIDPFYTQPLRIRRRHAAESGVRDPFELKPWPLLFGTRSRAEVLRRAESLGFSAHFSARGSLTLEHEQPAVRSHPDTGARAWLNHLLVFHASAPGATLDDAFRNAREWRAGLLSPVADAYRALAKARLFEAASDVTLADGSPIADSTVAHVRSTVARNTYALDWQAGDLAIVDNHTVLHGRRPFRGPRDVVVAWSEARA